MPELPEVEVTRRGLAAQIGACRLSGARVRQPRLRWPVADDLDARLRGRVLRALERRGKYLLWRFDRGSLIVHLGMSGSLRVLPAATPPGPHDHLDLLLADGRCVRLRDPRRFGAVLWSETDALRHPLLAGLGIEPLSEAFDGDWLHDASRGSRAPIKTWLMNARKVVGVGNIYANEALFRAGIAPTVAAGRLGRERCRRLADAVRATLEEAIAAGGSSLRDFLRSDGRPGYFQFGYRVYGRAGQACPQCGAAIRASRQGQRATYHCPRCQR